FAGVEDAVAAAVGRRADARRGHAGGVADAALARGAARRARRGGVAGAAVDDLAGRVARIAGLAVVAAVVAAFARVEDAVAADVRGSAHARRRHARRVAEPALARGVAGEAGRVRVARLSRDDLAGRVAQVGGLAVVGAVVAAFARFERAVAARRELGGDVLGAVHGQRARERRAERGAVAAPAEEGVVGVGDGVQGHRRAVGEAGALVGAARAAVDGDRRRRDRARAVARPGAAGARVLDDVDRVEGRRDLVLVGARVVAREVVD